MSLTELKTEIERKAQEEASRIIESAKEEAERIVADANAKAEAVRRERTRVLTRELDAEARAELAISRMDRKGELLRLKSTWSNRVFEEAGKRISQIAENSREEYHELLSKLILEGVARLKGNKFMVEANSKDIEAIRKELKTILERAARIKNEKVVLEIGTLAGTALGGVVVYSEDGTQYFGNTLEARLSAAARNLAGDVYKILFGASHIE